MLSCQRHGDEWKHIFLLFNALSDKPDSVNTIPRLPFNHIRYYYYFNEKATKKFFNYKSRECGFMMNSRWQIISNENLFSHLTMENILAPSMNFLVRLIVHCCARCSNLIISFHHRRFIIFRTGRFETGLTLEILVCWTLMLPVIMSQSETRAFSALKLALDGYQSCVRCAIETWVEARRVLNRLAKMISSGWFFWCTSFEH